MRLPRPIVVLCLVVGACVDRPTPQQAPAPSASAPAAATSTPTVEMQTIVAGVEIPKETSEGIPLLTPMEFALMMLDPKDLEVAQRRKRAYAKRKVIMNSPDSPTARALNDLRDAHSRGELDVPTKGSGLVFSLPGTKPTHGRPPAGTRPSDDQ